MRSFLLCLLFFFNCTLLFAQQDTKEYIRSLSPEQQAKFFQEVSKYKFSRAELNTSAERFGVKPDSRHILRMVGQHPKVEWQKDIQSPTINKHVKGNLGTKFPDPQVIKDSYKKYQIDKESMKDYVRKQYLPQLKSQVEVMNAPNPLPKCAKSNTIKKLISKSKDQSARELVQDLVFLPPDLTPKDYDQAEILGKEVNVLVYESDKKTEIHRLARGLNVECLPQRFRTTKGGFFIDFGVNALKNYDEDYHSNGYLHKFFKNKL